MDDALTTAAKSGTTDKQGQYLTFRLGGEVYGLGVLQVREVIGMMDITAVPGAAEFVRGIINLRGKILPVIDVRLRFHMPRADRTDQTCIIVADVGQADVGFIVDEVVEVLTIPADQIEDVPALGTEMDTDALLGIAKTEGNVTILLDISKVLTGSALALIETAHRAAEQQTSEMTGD